MKEHPVLFSGPMVRAILAGRKTQTRRVVKYIPALGEPQDWCGMNRSTLERYVGDVRAFCPYGVPGDRLWVRETWAESDSEGGPVVMYKAGGYLMHGAKGSRRDGTWKDEAFPGEAGQVYEPDRWRPSIFLPRWASRITLEVTAVRVERLQQISEEDAKAEGVEPYTGIGPDQRVPGHGFDRALLSDQPHRLPFADLWDSINGKRAPWASNPWVWCVNFERVRA